MILSKNKTARSDSLWKKGFRKFKRDRAGMAALCVVIIYAIIALGAALGLWGKGWDELITDSRVPVSLEHLFGTNWNGQDIFQRAIYSTRTAFEIGVVVAVFSICIGAITGCVAGYFNGTWIDELVLWFMGCLDCMPFYLFVAAVAYALKQNPFAMHIAMVATFWTTTGRLIRGEVIKLKNFEFVEAARAIAVPRFIIMFRHILPNTSHILLVQATITFISAVKAEVILSFLGLGVKEGISWGVMISESTQEVTAGIYNNFLAASVLLFVLVMAFNVFSDALQDALDPKKI